MDWVLETHLHIETFLLSFSIINGLENCVQKILKPWRAKFLPKLTIISFEGKKLHLFPLKVEEGGAFLSFKEVLSDDDLWVHFWKATTSLFTCSIKCKFIGISFAQRIPQKGHNDGWSLHTFTADASSLESSPWQPMESSHRKNTCSIFTIMRGKERIIIAWENDPQ